MTALLWVIGLTLFASFFLIVLRGAPYVPTHQRDRGTIFELHRFRAGEMIVDLGSGDGRVLSAAADRGVDALGYELNPFLAVYSWWTLRRYGGRARVVCRDFWRSELPDKTAVVFVFLASPFMDKLERKLRSEATRLERDILLISYGVELPGRAREREQNGYVLYRIKPS